MIFCFREGVRIHPLMMYTHLFIIHIYFLRAEPLDRSCQNYAVYFSSSSDEACVGGT